MKNKYFVCLLIGLFTFPFSFLFSQFPTSGLIANYPFAGNANDLSSFANHATETNVTLTTDRFGNNRAYLFNGSTSVVQAPDAAQLRPVNMTASVWVNNQSTSGFHSIVGKSIGTNVCDSWQLFIYGTSGGVPFSAVSCFNTGTGFTPFLLTPRTDNVWTHLVYVFDDDNDRVKLYKDNVLVDDQANLNSMAYDNRPLMIGLTYEGGALNFPFNGTIDDVRIYNRVLSVAEISALFTEPAYMAVNPGNWSSPATWAGGAVPPSGADITIEAAVTVDGAFTVGNLTVSAGASLASNGADLSLTTGSTLTTTDAGEIIGFPFRFLGSGTVVGTPIFSGNVYISGGVNFGTATISSCNLSIQFGGFVSGVTPTYQNAGLIYESGGNFTSGLEWSNLFTTVLIKNMTNVTFTNTTLSTINSSLTIENGSTLNLSATAGGDLALNLHLYAYGTLNCNERTVKFIGGGEKYIYAKAGESITFDYLDVGASFLDLFQGDVIVDNELIFSTGKVWLVYGNLVLNSNAIVTGASDGNVIFNENYNGGLMIKGVTSAGKTFPIGTYNGNLHPITIKPTNTTDFLIKLKPAFTNAPLLASKAVILEWEIIPSIAPGDPGPGTTTLIFKPHPSKLTVDNTPGNAIVGHFTGGNWVEHPATYNALAGTWTYIHSSTFSPFAVGVAGAFAAPLEVELIDFKAQIKDVKAELTWQTASEIAVKNFDIEKSLDGKKFGKIGETSANNTPSVYSAFDEDFTNSSYYRLKMNDLDGRYDYSKIVYLEKGSGKGIKILRNTEGRLSVETDDKIELITVSNTIGQIVKSTKDKQLSINDLNAGTYLISVKTDRGFLSQKLFKQ
jgi:Concanavalin A-like lectin/glucanases superfamily